ncbi:hypothetical protein PMIN01_08569 [Paraphaeosphaeria minitans]|uniref:Uncharacterized protein n=1 Tax=Paraphaeosphaeria minitans TaxID=565426 RepID=A0A9P6GBZ3_9PLEO|nr:hypothetical protein PMIN01_08569 [Paraphaeosphaeria minitans]
MVQKNDTVAIIVSLLVVIIVLIGLIYCCTAKRTRTFSDTDSYTSGSDPEKNPSTTVPTGLDGEFNVLNGRESRRHNPSHRHDGSFNAGNIRPSRAGTPRRPDGDFNAGSRQNSRRPSRTRELGSRGPIVAVIPHDHTFISPGDSRRDRGILRNDRARGGRGPSRVGFQPDSGEFNAANSQHGRDFSAAQDTDGAFNVGGNTGHTAAAKPPAQPAQRGGQGGSTMAHLPRDGSGSEASGAFNVG